MQSGSVHLLSACPPTVAPLSSFRHESWLDEETCDLLRSKNCALVVSDTDEKPLASISATADWGYLRLRRTSYADDDLKMWMQRVTGTEMERRLRLFQA
jgi:uncharacterized protein YecE (DUF72 family)